MWPWIKKHRHKIQGYFWILMLIPTVLWWKDSVLWVAAMSIYANVESSWAASEAEGGDKDGHTWTYRLA